jgi:hypothetical protein
MISNRHHIFTIAMVAVNKNQGHTKEQQVEHFTPGAPDRPHFYT